MAESDRAAQIEAEICVEALPTTVEAGAVEEFPYLANGVKAWMKFKEPDHRAPGFHPSGFSRWCSREAVFNILARMSGDVVKHVKHAPSTMMRFQAGHATHNWWQSRLFGEMGVLYGIWQCSKCGHVHGTDDDLIRMPKECVSCGKGRHALWFKEAGIEVPASKVLGVKEETLTELEKELFRIVGHYDGMLRIKGHPDMVAEVKSEDPELWKRRCGPESSHVIQGLIYAYASGVDHVAVIYVNKSSYDLKTYRVNGVNKVIREQFQKIRAVRKAVQATSPESLDRACPDAKHQRAKTCPFKSICFHK